MFCLVYFCRKASPSDFGSAAPSPAPAGGVSTTEEALGYYTLVKEILGEKWLDNEYFRIGASRLANNLLSDILGEETKFF